MADTSKITLKQLKDAMNKAKNYTDNEIAGVTGVSTVEPEALDMPKVFFNGDKPTNKTSVYATIEYISKTEHFKGYVDIKCQGTSSMAYPKKNYTIKMFSDEARSTKLKKDFKGWGKQSKFCLKANYIDHSHARNIIGAKLWDEIVASRANYAELPELLRTSPHNGAIDGFPIKVYYNNTYEGVYTWNIPKDKWMFNMDDMLDIHCVLCGEEYSSGCFRTANASLWSDEIHDVMPESIKTSFNNFISFVMNSSDDEFKTNLENYVYVDSLIDYYIFQYVICGLDSMGKNQLFATYDGIKWIATSYDMDSTFGLYWDGKKFVSTTYRMQEDYESMTGGKPGNLLYIRLEQLFCNEIKARYAELRANVLSYSNIVNEFERFMDTIGKDLYAEDLTIYTGIPSGNTNNIQQIRNYTRDRLTYVDTQIEALRELTPCTGIVLSADTLSFTTTDTQTLSVVVSPDNTTDTVNWSVSPSGIVTVVNGVVTPVTNGSCTITATCGSYSDTCNVTVNMPIVECTDITLDKNTLQLGAIQGTVPDSTTNLLEALTWEDGTVQDDGIIREGTDKYVEVTITVPGVYKLNQTGKYVYLKVIDVPTVVGHPYVITHASGNDIVFNVFDTPRTFLISVYPNNQIWNPSLVTLNYMSSIKESCTLFDDEQQITDANLIKIKWTDTDYNYIELSLNSIISQNKVVVKFNNVNYRVASSTEESVTISKAITNLALDNYTLFSQWDNKTLFYFRLPIAWGSTKEEIMNYMITNDINKLVINPSDYINSLPTAGAVTTLSQQLTATVIPDNCTQPVVWSVSPEGIATVDNGLVTAVANGEATVTATCGTQSATCTVTVSGMS